MVTIELTPFSRPTVSWFIMQYLFSKAEGNRKNGEEYTAEMHRQWQQFCGKMGKHCGSIESFRREVRRMKILGIVEASREEGDGSMPRQYYVLSEDYFAAMTEESRKAKRR